MKYQGLTFPMFALIAFTVVFLNSSNSGGNLNGACSSCHGNNTSANGSIILTGLPSNVVLSTTYPMQLCIIDPSQLAAGFRVETDLGTLVSIDGETQVNGSNDRITHTFPKTFGASGNPACWDFDWTAPNSGALDPSFTLRGNAVNSNGSTSGDNAGYIESSQGLPVEFASFNIEKNGSDIEVYWTTATEINNDRFVIQRSTDDVIYTNIGTVSGNNNSQDFILYQYTDKTAPKGTLYYRIIQIDIDGAKDYSSTRVLENVLSDSKWSVYPNPINLNATCVLNIDNTTSSLTLIDRYGSTIRTYTEGSYQGYIDIGDNLATGIYYLTDGSQTVSISVLR